MGMLGGVARSAAPPGTKENPVMAPPVLRLTSAVICCHRGRPATLISSPHFRWHWAVMREQTRRAPGLCRQPGAGQVPKDGLDLRVAGVVRVFEQHGGVLRGVRTRADDPLPVDIGHEGGLPGGT